MIDDTHRALFLDADPLQRSVALVAIFAHLALVGAAGVWVCYYGPRFHIATYEAVLLLLAGLFVADFISGVVHWATDTWFTELSGGRVIAIAREHHLYPQHIVDYGFLDYVAYSSLPTFLMFAPILLPCLFLGLNHFVFDLVVLSTFVCAVMIFGTYAHRMGHRKARWPVVIALQRANLLMNPQHHMVHHRDNHDTRYCVINGWANYVCDAVGFWRFAENAIYRLTGLVPRAHDHLCFARFREDRSFVNRVWWGYGVRAGKEPISRDAAI